MTIALAASAWPSTSFVLSEPMIFDLQILVIVIQARRDSTDCSNCSGGFPWHLPASGCRLRSDTGSLPMDMFQHLLSSFLTLDLLLIGYDVQIICAV